MSSNALRSRQSRKVVAHAAGGSIRPRSPIITSRSDGVGERAQQHWWSTLNRGVRADPEREGEDGDGRKPGVRTKARGVFHVVDEVQRDAAPPEDVRIRERRGRRARARAIGAADLGGDARDRGAARAPVGGSKAGIRRHRPRCSATRCASRRRCGCARGIDVGGARAARTGL